MESQSPITDKIALSLKPEKLNVLIEPELFMPSPRPMIWRSKTKLCEQIEELLISGIVARAWVTKSEIFQETGPESGPCYDIRYCFETDDKLIHGRYRARFDALHLAYGHADFYSWLTSAYKEGGTFSVLYRKENPSDHKIYGNLELYIEKKLTQITEELKDCKDKEELTKLAGQFLDIALGPRGKTSSYPRRYYSLLKKLDLYKSYHGIRNYKDNLETIKKNIPAGIYDEKVLISLSKYCQKYTPGIWAAY